MSAPRRRKRIGADASRGGDKGVDTEACFRFEQPMIAGVLRRE